MREGTRAFIAIIAAVSAFIAPLAMMILALLGFADLTQSLEFIKTWTAFIGPFAGAIIGFYFHRDAAPPPVPGVRQQPAATPTRET